MNIEPIMHMIIGGNYYKICQWPHTYKRMNFGRNKIYNVFVHALVDTDKQYMVEVINYLDEAEFECTVVSREIVSIDPDRRWEMLRNVIEKKREALGTR